MWYRITLIVVGLAVAPTAFADELPGTQPLTIDGDIAAQMVAGADDFLLREIKRSVDRRGDHWKRDFSSPEAYNRSIEPNRQRLLITF